MIFDFSFEILFVGQFDTADLEVNHVLVGVQVFEFLFKVVGLEDNVPSSPGRVMVKVALFDVRNNPVVVPSPVEKVNLGAKT